MSGLSDTSAFEAFNRMAEKIEEEERRSLAQAEVTQALEGDTLEEEFLRLEAGDGGRDVEEKLLALKSQMGLLPEGTEAPKQLEAGDEGQAADAARAPVQDAEVEEVSGEEAEDIPEAQLLSEFEKLEEKQAEN